MLKAENPSYPSIIIGEENPAEIWGVVVGCVRKMS
jgi:SOS-response transcriptional repressor LexA